MADLKATISIQTESAEFPVIPGSAASIPFSVQNLGSSEDYFEISVLGIPKTWVAIPSPVIFLAAGEKKDLSLSVQAPASPQATAGYYPIKLRISSQKDPQVQAETDISLKVAVYEVQGRIGILMHTNQFTVTPGGSVTIPIVLRNQGLHPDSFRLGVDGIPAIWISTSSPFTRLEPGEQKGITLNIRPPQAPESRAGRHPFTIQIISPQDPTQATEVSCTLTLAAYTQSSAALEPELILAGQMARLVLSNQGNIQETYTVGWQPHKNDLTFNPAQPQPVRVQAGESAGIEFTAAPRLPRLFGGESSHNFTVHIQSAEKEAYTLDGAVQSRGLLPVWTLPVGVVFILILFCATGFLIYRGLNQNPSATQTAQAAISQITQATQTAAFNQTAAAVIGEQDSDGDGLTNQRESELGTDPNNADSDKDEVSDGDEVLRQGTDPITPDTDGDGLTDGEELIRRGTDPKNPDTDGDQVKDGEEARLGTDPKKPDSDGDGLNDSDEIVRGTSPLNPDTDGDRLADNDEVKLGTNPLNPDTDNDRRIDSAESTNCPNYFNPDSDGDGIIDGLDIDPCDAKNPSLTATIEASITQVVPTQAAPTLAPTLLPTQSPTGQPTAAPTVLPLTGVIAFESNREGNSEIYVSRVADGAVTRLTNNPAADTQPAWSQDGSHIAFTTNRDGNNEIYLMNSDGSSAINLSNNPADDQFPCWSPDGAWVAFTSNRDGNQEIYVVRSDGSELKNLTNNPANDFQSSWMSVKRVFIVDEWIAFTSDRDGNQEIYTMRPNGLEPVNISLNPNQDSSPKGDPDGQVVFSSNRDGSYDIFLMNLDGTGLSKLTTNPAQDQLPTWSPDWQWIAFNSDRDGNPEIYIMRTNGADAANYTRSPATDAYAAWR